MIRTQISLTEAQMRRLRRAAALRRVSVAFVIREAIEANLPEEETERTERQRRAFALAGAFESGHTDTAARHDEILTERPRW